MLNTFIKIKLFTFLVFTVHQISNIKLSSFTHLSLKLYNAILRAVLITTTKCPSAALCNVANTTLINSWVVPEAHIGTLIGNCILLWEHLWHSHWEEESDRLIWFPERESFLHTEALSVFNIISFTITNFHPYPYHQEHKGRSTEKYFPGPWAVLLTREAAEHLAVVSSKWGRTQVLFHSFRGWSVL